ncbi:Uu.00g059980.m01.CDS01 [Anthostomella pinea]|uniref:Uu.00g059980.m01.CDS01 n=1 Tax=Anthostomella pinea TaxID=933095 RepID=A0AAI8YMA4_9PEZI|nr:Uu.00g059980.m01.CDS01 [Anthostomella pinea]
MPAFRPPKSSGDDVATTKIVRRLGHNESYQLGLYMLNQYRGTSVSGRYQIPRPLANPDQQEKLVGIVEAALCDNIMKHHVLHVGILDATSSRPAFVQLDSLELRQHIEWQFLDASAHFEAALQHLTEIQIDAPYPRLNKQPGWGVVVLHQKGADFLEIMFTWSHPHADGMSGKIFHQSLISSFFSRGMNDKHPDMDAYTLGLPRSLPKLPPPIEQIMSLPLGTGYLVKMVIDDIRPPILTHFRSFTVDDSVLSQILAACRQHQTTLTGLFHGLVLAALATHLNKGAASGFEAATTIDQRRFVPSAPEGNPWLEPKQTIGNFVSIMYHTFEPELVAKVRSAALSTPEAPSAVLSEELAALIWEAAVQVRREVSDKVDLGVRNDLTGTMRFVKDWRAQLSKVARKPRHASWLITGLGILDGEAPPANESLEMNGEPSPTDSWRIRRAQFVLSAEVPGAALNISPLPSRVSDSALVVAGRMASLMKPWDALSWLIWNSGWG